MIEDVLRGWTAVSDAAPGYEEAHRYYDGSVEEVFASRTLQRVLRKSGERFKINVIASVADAVADRLEILSTSVVGAEDGDLAAQKLAEVWTDNALLFEAPNIHHRAAEYGDAFAMVWEGENEGDTPVVNYLSPLSCRVVYDRDNPRKKLFAVHVWRVNSPLGESAGHWRVNLLYPDRIEKWATTPGLKPEEQDAWNEAPALDDQGEPAEEWPLTNPYGEVPVFHFRNGTPYGTPEHFKGYGAQDALNKLVITHMSSVDFLGFPQRYALTESVETDDDFDLDDDPEFVDPGDPDNTRADGAPGLETGPGKVWWLKNVKSVGQFDAADSSQFTDPATFYMRLMAQTTHTPLHMIDTSGDEPSGESRRRKEAPLTKKVRDRQQQYASTWQELLAFALKIAGFPGRAVVVRYAPAEVVSDAEGWATIKAKIEAGVPVRQALEEAGYTTEQVDEWFPEDAENNLRVADLLSVADVLQKIGAAVALGIITAEEGRAMLPEGVLPEGAPAPPPPPAPVAPPTMN